MKGVGIILAVSLCATAAPAPAQDWKPNRTAEAELHAIAKCVVKTHRDLALAVFATTRGAPDEKARIFAALDKSGCVAGATTTFKATNDVARGALAEQFYLGDFAAAPTIAPVSGATVPGAEPVTLTQLVDCAVARDPGGADALVRAERRSDAEKAMGARISPALNACARGTRFDLNGAQIRGALAEALYKLRSAAAPGTN